MSTGPGKRNVDNINYDQMKGKKSMDIDSYSVTSGSVWDYAEVSGDKIFLKQERPSGSGQAQPPLTLTPEEVIKNAFAPVNQAVIDSDISQEMRKRVQTWVSALMIEALAGERADPKNVDNYIGNLYYFCEDIFAALVQVVAKADQVLPAVFQATINRYARPG